MKIFVNAPCPLLFLLLNTCIAFAQSDIVPEFLINPGSGFNGGIVKATDMVGTNDGNIYQVGYFTNTADFDPGADTFNLTFGGAYVAKYDASGKFVLAFNIVGGAYIAAAATDFDNNIYIAGTFSNDVDFNPGIGVSSLICKDFTDIFFAKYDANGNFIFAKQISGGGTKSQFVNDIAIDTAMNIYLAGNFEGVDVDFDPGPKKAIIPHNLKEDIFFAKYDINGNYIFAKSIGSDEDESASGLVLDREKHILITGFFRKDNTDFDPGPGIVNLRCSGYSNIYTAKYDSLGNYITAFSLGGTGADYGNGIATDFDGNIILTGGFSGTGVDFDPLPGNDHQAIRITNGSYDIYIAKYTPDGSFLFANTIGGITDDFGTMTVTDHHGNIYITGTFSGSGVDFNPGINLDTLSAAGISDIFFAKYNSMGNYIYAKNITGKENESLAAIVASNDDKLLLAGTFSGTVDVDPSTKRHILSTVVQNAFLAVYNDSGDLVNALSPNEYRNFYVQSYVTAVTHDKQRNIYITGSYQGQLDFDPGPGICYLTSASDVTIRGQDGYDYSRYLRDIFFAKYSADGKLIFAKTISGKQQEYPTSIALDDENNIYLSGVMNDSVDFDAGPESFVLYGNFDLSFFAKYNSNGDLIFAKLLQISGYGGGAIHGIRVDKNKNIYITGEFLGTADFDPGPGKAILKAIGETDIFFARYDSLGNYIYCKQIGTKGNNPQFSKDIRLSKKGNIIITGSFTGKAMDFDPGAGIYMLNSGLGGGNAHYIAAYTNEGEFLFASAARTYSNGFSDAARLYLDKEDNIYITGKFHSKIDFDPGPDSAIMIAKNNVEDFYFEKYDAGGKYIFAKAIATQEYTDGGNIANSIYIDDYNSIYITGHFGGTADFDPGPGIANIGTDSTTTFGSYYIFLAKYDSSGNYAFAYALKEIKSSGQYNMGIDVSVNNYGEIILAGHTPANMNLGINDNSVLLNPEYDGYNFFTMVYQQPLFCAIADSLFTTEITANTAILHWRYPYTSAGFKILYKPIASDKWSSIKTSGNILLKKIANLLPGTRYVWKIIANCGSDTSNYSGISFFKTKPVDAFAAAGNKLIKIDTNNLIMIYPNPAKSKINISSTREVNLQLRNGQGQLILTQKIKGNGSMDLSKVPAGIYYVINVDSGEPLTVVKE